MKKAVCAVLTVLCLVVLATPIALAADINIGDANPCDAGYVGNDICQPISETQEPSTDSIWVTVQTILNYLLTAVGVLAVIMIIISAIQIATSAGNAEKVKKAKSTLLWAVVGLALALIAGVIVNLVTYFADQF